MKLIQTKDYLLLNDEEAEIKYNTIIFESDTRLINVVGKGYVHNKTDFKIIAYYPLTEEAKELDLPLLPPFEEVDIEKEALDISELKNKWGHLYTFGYPSKPYPTGFQNDLNMIMLGLYKSKSKQFSLEDILSFAKFCCDNHTLDDSNKENIMWTPFFRDGKKLTEIEMFDNWKKSISTQQLPKEFIPEYQYQCSCYGYGSVGCNYENNINNPVRRQNKCEREAYLKTITNSEGKLELVGTYKY